MQNFADCTVATALGAGGVETSMGTIVVTAKARTLVGVWATIVGGATLTTGQPISGIFRLDSPDVNLAPAKFPLSQVSILTSGAFGFQAHIIPVEIPIVGLANITCYITIDLTNTAALKGRVGFLYQG